MRCHDIICWQITENTSDKSIMDVSMIVDVSKFSDANRWFADIGGIQIRGIHTPS